MSTTRNDIHRPSQIIPADYDYVGCEVVPGPFGPMSIPGMREAITAHMKRTGGTYSKHEHGGNCHICGSVNLIYSILYYHEKSNSYIRMGDDCAAKLDFSGSREMNLFRKSIREQIGVAKGKAKAQAILAEGGLSRAWDISEAYQPVDFYAESKSRRDNQEQIIADIVGKLVRWGSISEAQTNFLGKLIAQIDSRAERAAVRKVENEAAADCPTGRIVVTGTVLSTKLQESQFGTVLKMLVRDDSGFKVWCTVPAGEPLNKGDKVTFTVSVEPSKDDSKFGFGKRPAKLTNLTAEAQQGSDLAEPAPRDESYVPDVASNGDNYYAS